MGDRRHRRAEEPTRNSRDTIERLLLRSVESVVAVKGGKPILLIDLSSAWHVNLTSRGDGDRALISFDV